MEARWDESVYNLSSFFSLLMLAFVIFNGQGWVPSAAIVHDFGLCLFFFLSCPITIITHYIYICI